jgi:hypothetical protein
MAFFRAAVPIGSSIGFTDRLKNLLVMPLDKEYGQLT